MSTTDALSKLIHEAVKFAIWAGGQGISPAKGEPAEAPEEFVYAYSQATGDEDWDTLPERAAAFRATPPSPVPVSETTEAQADVLGVPKSVIEKVLAYYAAPPLLKVAPGEVKAAIADGPGSIIAIEPYAPPSPAPDGWVLVPREPTPEMVRAGSGAQNTVSDCGGGLVFAATETDIYRAMISAAPAAPTEAPNE